MGIPNLFPYKEEMLDAMERKETLDKQKQEELRILRQAKQHIPEGNLESFAQEIKRKVESFEKEKKYDGLTKEEIEEAQQLIDPNSGAVGQSRRAYYKELRKVMEAADVIIEVLDARDP